MTSDPQQQDWSNQWDLRPGVTYLNHGSFGPPPRPVQAQRRQWQQQLDSQPMDFFDRQFESALQETGLAAFREHGYCLTTEARNRLAEWTGLTPITPDDRCWYTCMGHAPLPSGDASELQRALWQRHAIEVPIVFWKDRYWIRVSCHWYNHRQDIDRLFDALTREIRT